MGLLRIDAQLTATELDDVDAVASAFSHLLGTTDVVEVTGDRSHHGAELLLMRASVKRKADLRTCLDRLGDGLLRAVSEELDQRLDDSGQVHLRLDLHALVSGVVRLHSGQGSMVKIKMKFQSWPGEVLEEVILEELGRIDRAGETNP